ncbi:MAG: nucleotide exchange factor GrpE, partial [Prevotella sp.]|nr:nucleotide exchange factor GrpE [Prevotella sp.]
MTKKDIKIENEETLNETPLEETDNQAENSENSEESENAENAEEKDPLEVAQAEIAELKSQLLYKAAEFDNYRKRTLKER